MARTSCASAIYVGKLDHQVLVSPLGPLSFGLVQEELDLVCGTRKESSSGTVEVYICQIIDTTDVNIESFRVDDIWSRMTTITDEHGAIKTT